MNNQFSAGKDAENASNMENKSKTVYRVSAGLRAADAVGFYSSLSTTENLQTALRLLKEYEEWSVKADDTIDNGYKSIYGILSRQCSERSKNFKSKEVDKKVQHIIEHTRGSRTLNDLKIAIDVLNSTNKLLTKEMDVGQYQNEAKKYQQIGCKVIGALMMALGSIMVAAGIGLCFTGVGTGIGTGAAIAGVSLIASGSTFFKAGKVANRYNESMNELATKMEKENSKPSPK